MDDLNNAEREEDYAAQWERAKHKLNQHVQQSQSASAACVFYIHGFSISWSAFMASSFNFNHVSLTPDFMWSLSHKYFWTPRP